MAFETRDRWRWWRANMVPNPLRHTHVVLLFASILMRFSRKSKSFLIAETTRHISTNPRGFVFRLRMQRNFSIMMCCVGCHTWIGIMLKICRRIRSRRSVSKEYVILCGTGLTKSFPSERQARTSLKSELVSFKLYSRCSIVLRKSKWIVDLKNLLWVCPQILNASAQGRWRLCSKFSKISFSTTGMVLGSL